MKYRFSVPYFPLLSTSEIVEFIQFLKENKRLIHDVYATVRIEPFNSDAMGIQFGENEREQLVSNAKAIQEQTGIPISATFNNITISPNYANYLKFIKEFRPLYEAGIRSVTIPFVSWLRFGLKNEFPNLFVKNTILSSVSEPSEVYKLFLEGFDYINIDRYLIRYSDRLKEIKKAKLRAEDKLGKKLFLSILMNEHCEGHCPVQQEHFGYNFHNNNNSATFFNSEMKHISCESHLEQCPQGLLYSLKTAIIPPLHSSLDHYAELVDVFKMHGRESKNVFNQTLSYIKNINNSDIIDRQFIDLCKKHKLSDWLEVTKNCQFKCYSCDLCDRIAQKNDKGDFL